MATTVEAAFREFLQDHVNLHPSVADLATRSRAWLLTQIAVLPDRHRDVPPLFEEKNVHYGSFARKTQIRELDDVDLIIAIRASGSTYLEVGQTVTIQVPDGVVLRSLCHDGTNNLNSRRVINRFRDRLAGIPQYRNAEISRNYEAVVLNLLSYTWSFDIVPGFFTTPEWDGRTYYIIPDGYGNWKKTDPRIDEDRVAAMVQERGRTVLEVIRLLKYWNYRRTAPAMPSYLLECIVLDYYTLNTASQWADFDIQQVLRHLANAILTDVPDPKGVQGNLNSVSIGDRIRIWSRALDDARVADSATVAESNSDHREAIRLWGGIFGSRFPKYE
jgi:hypothetical protein